MAEQQAAAAKKVREAIGSASQGLIERETLVELITLAAVAREHLLVIGAPGTAKSEAVRRIARAVGGEYFEYLLGRFTEPSEIFGPVDLRKLKEGLVETETAGMLPEAEIAFLDEVFQGSTAILNTLLGILNERVFRRGHTNKQCPLRICVGASNQLPADDMLAAFADRFLLRVFIEPLSDPMLEELLAGGWMMAQQENLLSASASISDLDLLAEAARNSDIATVRDQIAHALRLLRSAGITLSDRRIVKTQKLVAAAAALAGRDAPMAADLWPIVYVVPTREQQFIARDCLREILKNSHNESLPAAAEEASLGALARAHRIATQGNQLLEQQPVKADAEAWQAWRLKLESIAREIDAGFSKEQLPATLTSLRAAIVEQFSKN